MEQKLRSLLKLLVFPRSVNSKGSILILSLWSLCLLSTFAVVLGFVVRQKLTLVNRLDERARLHFIADAGIKKAINQFKEEPSKSYDALNDNWSNNVSAFKEIDIGGGKFSISHDFLDEHTGLTEAWYGLIDEESKININKASRSILERFFKAILDCDDTQAQELAAAMVDWRDSDSELSIPIGSAEDSYYQDLEYPYEAKDANFEVLEEVLLVKGMDKTIFDKIKNYITIYSSGRININTVSEVVLFAFGLSPDLVDKIVSFRRGEDGVIGTTDDNIFDIPSNIVPKLNLSFHLSESETTQISIILEQYLVTHSNNFMARCIAQLNGKKKVAEVVCVINRSGKIQYFQES